MVLISPPPPSRLVSAVHFKYRKSEPLIRIFDSAINDCQAKTFRTWGPLHRFDHHQHDITGFRKRRGILYGARKFSSCIVEVFGDSGFHSV